LSTFISDTLCPSLAKHMCVSAGISQQCNKMAFDSLRGRLWNKKLWEGIDRDTVEVQPTYTAVTNSYSTFNAQIHPESTRLLISNKRHNDAYTHAEILSHNPGFGFGNFSIKFKASTDPDVRTAFYLTSDPHLNLQHSIFIFILASTTCRLQAGEFQGVPSRNLSFNAFGDFHKYTIERLPNTVSFYANNNLLARFNLTTSGPIRVGFSVFAQQGWNPSSVPLPDGSFTSAEFKDFQYCPFGCNYSECKC